MIFRIWVGKRESDILTYNYFDVSITFWGSNTNNNHAYCTNERIKDNYGTDFVFFVLNHLDNYIAQNKNINIEIHFYNNSLAYKLINLNPALEQYIVNINSQRVFNILRHKTLSRVWLQNIVDVPQFIYLSKEKCQYQNLLTIFPYYTKFVIQKSLSGGGTGTYLMTAHNHQDIIDSLSIDDIYLVSPYYENNHSLSCHLIISNNEVMVFPISEQLLNYRDNRISYCGNKYLNSKSNLFVQTKRIASLVGYELMSINYRGICGLDFLSTNDRLMLVEINPRYQGSSYLINAELNERGLPSLFSLNSQSFNGYVDTDIINKIEKMIISYESHTCIYSNTSPNISIKHNNDIHIFLDGLNHSNKYEDGVYLYRYLKKRKDITISDNSEN